MIELIEMIDILLSALARNIRDIAVSWELFDFFLEKKKQRRAKIILRVKFRPQDFVKPTNQ